MAKSPQTNIGRALAEVGVAGVAPAIAAAVAPAIAAATASRGAAAAHLGGGEATAPIAGAAAGRLPAFDPALAEQLPSSVSRVAFMDKWVNHRIDEAAATTARMDRQITQLARAQEAMQKLCESVRAEIATVGPTMNLLHEAEKSAQESAEKLAQEMAQQLARSAGQSAERIAREHVESFIDGSGRAVSAALEPVEQQCAQRLEAMLQEADARIDAASKHVVARTREELRLMEQQWMGVAQQVRDSLNATLAAAQASASELADTIEKALASAGAAAEALARNGVGKIEKPAVAESREGSGAAAVERCDVGPGVTVSIPDGVAAAGDRALRALDAASVVLHRAA